MEYTVLIDDTTKKYIISPEMNLYKVPNAATQNKTVEQVGESVTYIPDKDYIGFSSITVNAKTGIFDSENLPDGTFNASSDNVLGYKQVRIKTKLKRFSVEGKDPGTYYAYQEGVKGYSAVEIPDTSEGPENALLYIREYNADGTVHTAVTRGVNFPDIPSYFLRGIKTAVYINESKLSSIGDYAFYETNLKEVHFDYNNNDTISIGKYAFYNNSELQFVPLTLLFLNPNVTINSYAFHGCSSLYTDWSIYDLNENYYNKSEFATIKDHAFSGCSNIIRAACSHGVSSNAFENCTSLKYFKMTNGYTIGTYAFYGCSSLIEILFPEDAHTIESYAFKKCSSLENIDTKNISKLGANAFDGCTKLKYVNISMVNTIYAETFKDCSSLAIIDFRDRTATNISKLSNTSAFTGLFKDYKIIVPDSLYDSWIVGTNWSATGIVEHIIKASNYTE